MKLHANGGNTVAINVSLKDVLPDYAQTGFEFRRIELVEEEGFPLGLVWYTRSRDPQAETGARIDLQKQVFLDDFGDEDRSKFNAAAQEIVLFLHRRSRPVAQRLS